MGTRNEILTNLGARLATITVANGYVTDVKKVYYDDIPMGLELNDYDLPAIFLLDRLDELNTQQAIVEGLWQFDLQLWHNKTTDSDMLQFVGDIFKAIFANSPTAQINGSFRAIHAKIVEIRPMTIASDLHMIEANRVSIVTFQCRYRTKLFEM